MLQNAEPVGGRIIAGFPERLTEAQRQPYQLTTLAELAKRYCQSKLA